MTALTSPGLTPGRFRLVVRRPRVPRRWRTGLMIVGVVIIGCWLLVALLAPLISPTITNEVIGACTTPEK